MKRFVIAIMAVLTLTGVAEAKPKLKKKDFVLQTVVATPAATAEDTLVLQISTGGTVRIQLRPDKAPRHVARFKGLARAGFYDGLLFHRVIDGFMAQTGDPKGTGEGGSSLPDMKAEFNDLPHMRGAVSAARTDAPDTSNSQFFIVFQPVLRLDNRYTVFGRVLSGMEFVDAIERGEPPANPSRIVKAWIEADGADSARRPLPTEAEEAAIAPAPAAAPVAAVEPVGLKKPKKKKKLLGII